MFAGLVKFAAGCRACGMDFSAYNVGDGPAGFLTLGVGALITTLAITLELKAQPPLWLHFVLWLPLTVVAIVGSLRVAKGMLLALEHRNEAGEGRGRAAGKGEP